MSQRTVAVVGAGYVGLPMACAFAGAGLKTYVIDVLPERVRIINEGKSPIQGDEPGLQELLARTVKDGTLVASTDATLISKADYIAVCVNTPIDEVTKQPKLEILRSAVRSIGQNMKWGVLVSIESTLPPLTMRNVVISLLEEQSEMKAGQDFFVAHCPERVIRAGC